MSDEPHGLLRAYDEHRAIIDQAVRRRLAISVHSEVDEVQPTDFTDLFIADVDLPPRRVRTSPIYHPAATC